MKSVLVSHFHRFFLLFGVALLLAGGCAQPMSAGQDHEVLVEKPYQSRLDDPESNALYHFGRAQLLVGEGRVEPAIAALKRAIDLDPDSLHLRYLLAQLYAETGNIKEARRTLEDVLIHNPDAAKAHLVLGNMALNNGDPGRAAKYFRRVLEIDPDDSMVPLQLSIALVRNGDADQAIEALKTLLQKEPDSRPARLTLARLYREMGLEVLAEQQYRYLIDNLDNVQQAYLDLGYMYENQQDYESALAMFRQALEINPHDLALRHHLARIYVGMREYERALDELGQIIEADPDDLEARRKIGLIYMEQESWQEAEREFRKIIARNPDLDPARYYLGIALERQEKWSEALRVFSAIAETSALYADAVSHSGFLLMETGRPEDAAALLEDYLAKGEPRPQIYFYLGMIYRSQQRFGEALKVLEQGVQKFPDEVDLLYQQGIVLEQLGRSQQAIDVMLNVIEKNDQHAEAMNFVAYAWAEENINLDRALAFAEQALQLNPAAHIRDTLGWVYYRLERFEDARRQLEQAAQQLSKDFVVLQHLAAIYEKLGQIDRAREIYRRMQQVNPESPLPKEKLDALADS